MDFKKIIKNNTELSFSVFSNNNVNEIHLLAKPVNISSFDIQLNSILSAIENFMTENNINKESLVFTRYFVSDFANQYSVIDTIKQRAENVLNGCAVSVVQQPPLNDNKVVVWAYIIDDRNEATHKNSESKNELTLQRNSYKHVWSTLLTTTNSSLESSKQTTSVFESLNSSLKNKGLSIKNNCIRTWLFVKDVDSNYSGVVTARTEFFNKLGMTTKTHFIASTGIEGRHANPNINVLMDTYSVGGIQNKQIKFLEATDYLNPTHEYGVTFERGTSVDYGDRRHIFISGTASINNKGEVVHKKVVGKQIKRVLKNIAALLADADAEILDVAHFIIYLRDIADRSEVNEYFATHYNTIPKVILMAPVCRPEWLIEIECVAIKKITNNNFSNF